MCRVISKQEAHDYIDKACGNKVMLFSFDKSKGISTARKRIKKNKGKVMVDDAVIIILSDFKIAQKMDLLEDTEENVVNSLLLAQINEIT